MDEKDLEQLKKDRDEYLNGWKRAKADFINYKREEGDRMRALAVYARSAVLLRVLPILDNIDRALKEIQKPAQSPQGIQVVKGFLQIVEQWHEFLKQEGIVAIETVGKPFNPEFHEAVSEVEGAGQGEAGMVVEEVEKGYMMHGRLLRPAKVKVVK